MLVIIITYLCYIALGASCWHFSAIMVNRSTGQECCWPQHISSLNGQRRANNRIYPHVGREQRYPKMKQLALQFGKGCLCCTQLGVTGQEVLICQEDSPSFKLYHDPKLLTFFFFSSGYLILHRDTCVLALWELNLGIGGRTNAVSRVWCFREESC